MVHCHEIEKVKYIAIFVAVNKTMKWAHAVHHYAMCQKSCPGVAVNMSCRPGNHFCNLVNNDMRENYKVKTQ